MKPAPFDFKRVMTIDDAVSALGGEAGSVQLISGGQSLMPILNQRLANVTTLVDISQLDSLREIAASDAHIDIGAGVTAASIEDGAVAGSVGRLLSEVASGIGYRAVRNRGTVGGGIAFADPAGDWPSVLLALNAQITVISSRGTRQVPVDSLLEQPFQTTLASDEIVTTIRVPVLSEDARWSYYKFSPTIGEVTKAIAVALCDPSQDVYSLAIGAADGMPCRLEQLESEWRDQGDTFRSNIDLEKSRAAIKALNIAHSDYKLQCLGVALVRAVKGLS